MIEFNKLQFVDVPSQNDKLKFVGQLLKFEFPPLALLQTLTLDLS